MGPIATVYHYSKILRVLKEMRAKKRFNEVSEFLPEFLKFHQFNKMKKKIKFLSVQKDKNDT